MHPLITSQAEMGMHYVNCGLYLKFNWKRFLLLDFSNIFSLKNQISNEMRYVGEEAASGPG